MTFEEGLEQFIENTLRADYGQIKTVVLILFFVFWLFVAWWIYNDIISRTKNKYIQIFSVILVLVLNLPGLLIYFIIRPKDTLEEAYWADLERRYLLFETADLGECEKCGFQLRPGFVNCPNCNNIIKVKCSCGAMIDKNWKFCPYCGATATIAKENVVENKPDFDNIENMPQRPKYANKVRLEKLFEKVDNIFDKIFPKKPKKQEKEAEVFATAPTKKAKKSKNKSKKRK